MKAVFFIISFVFISLHAFSQKNLLNGMQGLSYEKGMIFEIEGYTINIEKNEASFDEKGFKKIKKRYELNNVSKEYRDSRWKWQNHAIESQKIEKSVPDVTTRQLCYLIPETDHTMTVVLFESLNRKDTLIEQTFMDAFFKRELSQYLSDNWEADKINFAGRTVPLGNICTWLSPFNVHCPSFGQISWSEFRTLEDAQINNEAHLLMNKYSGMYKTLGEEDVDILFEGYPNKAKRVIFQLKRSKVLLGGRNLLAVYYVVQRVRGKYLSCVLSHYVEDKNNYRLAPLLQEVMSLDTEETE